MRYLICGGRTFGDEPEELAFIFSFLDALDPQPSTVIVGRANGADRAAELWARMKGYEVLPFAADWQAYPRAAGPIRNRTMLKVGKPDRVVAFPGNKGTADMCKQAFNARVAIIRATYPPTAPPVLNGQLDLFNKGAE